MRGACVRACVVAGLPRQHHVLRFVVRFAVQCRLQSKRGPTWQDCPGAMGGSLVPLPAGLLAPPGAHFSSQHACTSWMAWTPHDDTMM